jgi:membrane fusion protein, hemolysin D
MTSSRFVPAPRREPAPGPLIRVYESETAEILEEPEPLQTRITVWVLAAVFASLFAVAFLMRMDRVVTSTQGQIVTTQPTIVLQALDASMIKTIDVQEGERVRKGQLLATLDPTFAAADVSALKLQLASLAAQIARCKAELAGKSFEVPAGLDPAETSYMALQKSYYEQRKAQFDAQLASYDAQIAQAKATIAKYRNDQELYAERARISKEIEAMRATLAAAQVGSKLNLLAATDQKLEILRNLEQDHNSLLESQHQLQSTISTRDAFVQQWLGAVSQELVTARNSRDAAREQLAKAARRRDLVRLVAPEDAVVLRLAKLSVGSVLKEGDPLVNLAPLTSPEAAEIHISTRDVGFIRAGDPVTLKLGAFNFVEHGTVEGRIRWISDGTFADEDGKPVDPYYKARVALTKVQLHNVPANFRLIPGMTLTADIKVGTRSVFAYLMRGLVGGVGEAMREP